jgi:hypothetical protein
MSDPFDVRQERARMLRGAIALADRVLAPSSELATFQLHCAQYFADEAGDAVHDVPSVSQELIPQPGTLEDREISHEVRWQLLSWDSNYDGVYAFAPFCTEDWSETGDEVGEAAMPSPLLIVRRDDGALRADWAGGLHRPWLDFPGAMKARDEGYEVPGGFANDPPAATLEGKERELHAQLVAEPANLGIRDVLRDLWMLRDDPRGELTALSAKPALDAAERTRVAELVLAHGRSWLGPLQRVIPLSGALFGYGPFVKKAVVYYAGGLPEIADAPEWATVEEIVFAPGSLPLVSPAMRNLRAVGPLRPLSLASSGGWLERLEQLDLDLASPRQAHGEPPWFASLLGDLALRRLVLRASGRLDFGPLPATSWWPKLERLEIWLPADLDDPAVAVSRTFHRLCEEHVAHWPERLTLAVGQLAGDQRSGIMLVGTPNDQRLELHTPDARFTRAHELARITGLSLPTSWHPDDDWLAFGLGVT